MIIRMAAISILLILTLITVPSSAGDVNPLYQKYSGILSGWHKARICMPCHINTLSGKDLEKFLSCTPCHNENLNLKNPEAIEKLHDANVCIKCHVGSEYNKRNLGLKVHVPHKNIDCKTCHGEDGAISKPDKTLCTECHGSNPHAVHSKNLDKICFDCHSEYIKSFLPEIKKERLVKSIPTPTPTPAPKEVSFKSLSDLILWIVNILFSF